MADLHHKIEIEASPEKVYEAITTAEGLRSWWTGDSVAEPRVGSIAEFGFFNRETVCPLYSMNERRTRLAVFL